MTERDNKLFVVFARSSNISVCSSRSISTITVRGLSDPTDIVVCRSDGRLYIADSDCIWRESSTDLYEKWLPTESTTDIFTVKSLSVTSQRLLVTMVSGSLHQYSTTDRQLLHVIVLPGYIVDLNHATETTRGTFVVCYRDTSNDLWQSMVSELYRFVIYSALNIMLS